MRTIPSYIFNPAKDSKPYRVTTEEADRWFYAQSIAGDKVDGYGGCPNVGITTALQHLDERVGYESYSHTFKSGKRKGESEVRWRKVNMDSDWDIVTSFYAKAGLGEDYALKQARVARILRAEDYEFDKQQPILWRP